ncbi:MAG: ABC transporter ATP-binding protein [Candidatus Sumerlaeia bacterium]|nr:ABC transporter ATP-binding protein [Candidatus Sumerlaeia bacterium]
MLSIEGLRKVYPPDKVAIDGLSLEVCEGVLGLLGPNGAGKSSLMEILSAGMDFHGGRVVLDGVHDVRRNPRQWRARLGYMPQQFDFPPFLTGREFVRQSLALLGRDTRDWRLRMDELLERANLTWAANRHAASYSRGMKQRLAFVMAVIHDPRLLLLDEPTAGLDPLERVFFRDLLAEISHGRITILSTHIVEDVEKCCQRIAVVNGGKLIYSGSPGELVARAVDRVWEHEISEGEIDKWSATRRTVSIRHKDGCFIARVLADGAPVDDAVAVRPGLEDAYFDLLQGDGVEPRVLLEGVEK